MSRHVCRKLMSGWYISVRGRSTFPSTVLTFYCSYVTVKPSYQLLIRSICSPSAAVAIVFDIFGFAEGFRVHVRRSWKWLKVFNSLRESRSHYYSELAVRGLPL